MATASVTGEMLGTPNAKMKAQIGKGGPKLVHAVDSFAGSGIGGGGITARPKGTGRSVVVEANDLGADIAH